MDRFGKLPLSQKQFEERLRAGQEFRLESHDLQYRLIFQEDTFLLQQGSDTHSFQQFGPALFTLLACIGTFYLPDSESEKDAHKGKSIRFIDAMIEYTLTELLEWITIEPTPHNVSQFATERWDFPLTEQEVEDGFCRRYARAFSSLSGDKQLLENAAELLPAIRAILVQYQAPVPDPFDMNRVNWDELSYTTLREIALIFAYYDMPNPLYAYQKREEFPQYIENTRILLKDGSVIERSVYNLSSDGQSGSTFHFKDVPVTYRSGQWIERSVLEILTAWAADYFTEAASATPPLIEVLQLSYEDNVWKTVLEVSNQPEPPSLSFTFNEDGMVLLQ